MSFVSWHKNLCRSSCQEENGSLVPSCKKTAVASLECLSRSDNPSTKVFVPLRRTHVR